MANLSGIIEQLKKERDGVQKQLTALNAALTAFVLSEEAAAITGQELVICGGSSL